MHFSPQSSLESVLLKHQNPPNFPSGINTKSTLQSLNLRCMSYLLIYLTGPTLNLKAGQTDPCDGGPGAAVPEIDFHSQQLHMDLTKNLSHL